MQLARAAARGAAATLVGQWSRFAVQTASTMVLARLLTPHEFGLVGMVLAFVMIAMLVKDLGLNTAIIQRPTISDRQVNTLFWLNLGLGGAVAALFWVSAPLLAGFYGRPELTGIVIGLSFAVIFASVASQPQALLSRRLDFLAIAVIDVAAITCAAAVAIAAAFMGAGYWALVLLHVIQPFVRAALVGCRCGWRPSLPARCEDMRSLLSFGSYLSLTQILAISTQHIDKVLIGRYVGATQLGHYSKAYELLLLPIAQIQGPLSRVAIPTLSRLQADPVRYRRYYTTALGAVAFITLPLTVVLVVLGEEIILVLLGSQWLGTVTIFKILALAAPVQAVTHAIGWLFVSLGRVRRQALWFVATRPFYVLAFIVALPWGARGVAIAYTVTLYCLIGPFYVLATRGSPVGLTDIVRAVWHPGVIGLATYGVAVMVRNGLAEEPLLVTLGGTLLISATFFAAVTFAWPSARHRAQAFLSVARTSLSKQARTEGDPTGSGAAAVEGENPDQRKGETNEDREPVR